MKLYGIAGFARSGKDTIAAYMVREHGYTRFAFADPMREMLYAINPIIDHDELHRWRVQDAVDREGWDYAKVHYPEIRALLQRLGTEGGRAVLGQNIWTDTLMNKVKANNNKVVIADVRFEDEAQAVKDNGGKMIRVARPGITSVNNHVSDKKLPDSFIDYEVTNDGTIANLEAKVSAIILA